jgi:hypothetical protein
MSSRVRPVSGMSVFELLAQSHAKHTGGDELVVDDVPSVQEHHEAKDVAVDERDASPSMSALGHSTGLLPSIRIGSGPHDPPGSWIAAQ